MGFTIKQKCDYLEALEKAQSARPADVGELIRMTAFNAGQLAKVMRLSGLIEWASKPKHLHRITEKGRKYKANPPAEIKAAGGTTTPPVTETVHETVTKTVTETVHETVLPQTPVLEEKSDKEKEDEGKIPSQADIFRSVAEQLSISKAKEAKEGTPLAAIINYVQRTGPLNIVSCSRSAQQAATSHMSHQSMLPTGKPRTFTTCWNTAPAKGLSNGVLASLLRLKALYQAIEAMRPSALTSLS